MKTFRPFLYIAVFTGTGFIFTQESFSAPTKQNSAAQSPDRTPEELVGEVSSDQKAVNELLGQDDAALKNPADRTAVAPKLIPALKKMRDDLDELVTAEPKFKSEAANIQPEILTMLSVLGDKESSDQIQSLVTSQDASLAIKGRADQFLARWMVTEKTVPSQTALIDDLEKMDQAHPDSTQLTKFTFGLSQDAASADLKKRILNIAATEMNNPIAASIKKKLASLQEAANTAALAENKPLTLAGSTPDGKAFSSAGLKGKVVLVDFWATWCGPCKAELPRVKKMYSEYHDKGLEILGISNDFDADALKSFVVKEQMPWPELFDANAAVNHSWNPITLDQGIRGIPTMYLIDKKGILRSISARENMEDLIPKFLAESN